jgi:hypothetical protein
MKFFQIMRPLHWRKKYVRICSNDSLFTFAKKNTGFRI